MTPRSIGEERPFVEVWLAHDRHRAWTPARIAHFGAKIRFGQRYNALVLDHLSLFAGAAVGFLIERTVVLGARFAWRFPRTFQSYAPYFLPYTLDIEVGLRF